MISKPIKQELAELKQELADLLDEDAKVDKAYLYLYHASLSSLFLQPI
jgi:hypothetical protein